VRFLAQWFIVVGLGLLAFFLSVDHEAANETEFQFAIGAVWFGAGLVMATALAVAPLACRRAYRPSLICISSFLGLLIAWALVVLASTEITPFFWHNDGWSEIYVVVLFLTSFSFLLLLSFLLLSFFNSLYRERLKAMLHMSSKTTTPPVLVPLH
jgi:hypothetical protein